MLTLPSGLVSHIENMDMNWPRLRFAVWILGFVFLAGGCLNFVRYIYLNTNNKSNTEHWVIGLSTVAGASLILALWGWRWYACKGSFTGPLRFPFKNIIRVSLPFIVFFVVATIFIKMSTYVLRSAPEYLESENVIKSNLQVAAIFGQVEETQLDRIGSKIETQSNTRSGIYQFRVKGSVQAGIVQISWHDSGDGTFIPTEIDQIMPDATPTPLWSYSSVKNIPGNR